MSSSSHRAPLSRASRVAVLSLWTTLSCGVVMMIGYVATLPASVWILVSVGLTLSMATWAVVVFREARQGGTSLVSATWRSVRLTWKAVWELVP